MNRLMMAVRTTWWLAIPLALCCLPVALGATPEDRHPRQRQPAALCLGADAARLYVANARSGSLSVVDVKSATVVAEHGVGRGLADIALLPDGPRLRLLAVDQAADSLLLLEERERDGSVQVVARLAVAPDPVSVVVTPGGGWCVVASRWSRRLTFVAVAAGTGLGQPLLSTIRTLDLPFSPRNMVLVRSATKLVVADAFAGRLAVIDPSQGTLESVRSLPAHNIRGLAEAPGGQTLVVAHQVLHRLARTSFEDVHWGSLLNNALRVLKLDQLLDPDPGADLLKGSRHFDLGDPGNGAGDPAAAAFAPDGHLVVALAGVDEIRIGTDPARLPRRTGVGRRPAALAVGADSRAVYVANTLDDSVSVVDLSTGLFRASIALGPARDLALSAAERGERLFFDARLSHDGWMSCHSCHTDGHSSGQSSDTKGDGGFGAPKQIPSLLGAGTTGPWGWLGSFERLDDQVRQSVVSTMQGAMPNDTIVSDLVAYLHTLEAKAPAIRADAAVARGRAVFRAQKCADCHAPPDYTTAGPFDVGLADEVGHRQFNPPSLRGVARREPLLHDGRAATLGAVFHQHHHPRDTTLSDGDLADLLEYLKTL
jgi:YVTN family beta-propeller protein